MGTQIQTIQEICAANGYNYKSNHSQTYRAINNCILSGTKVIFQKKGTVNTHLGKPYNLTIKVDNKTLRIFQPSKKMLDSKQLGEIIYNGILKLTEK